MSQQRTEELIQILGLQPHPEGGAYRRSFASSLSVQAFSPPQSRLALSMIYYLLRAGEFSCLHRISSDETWHFYEGAPLQLVCVAPDFSTLEVLQLGPLTQHQQPQQVIPAHHWQAARTTGDYALVGCTVAPAFEFSSFWMLRDEVEAAQRFRQLHPHWAELVGS